MKLKNYLTSNLPSISKSLIFIFIIYLIFVGYQFISNASLHAHVSYNTNSFSPRILSLNGSGISNNIASPARTLVIYVYAKTHELAEQNLVFFIRTAVRDSHYADYYFILQNMNNISIDENKLPLLPSNAHYLQHENKCFDIGTVGWFLSSGIIDKNKYKYFIFLNSSVRGPFIVSYYDNPIWYTIFTRRLNNHIKLVGCTVNCETALHVQSYVWALDLETLNLLLKDGTVFACYENKDVTISKAEVGASQIILKAGFGIDSLMKKFQAVNFRFNDTPKCINTRNPTFNKAVDGISLDPFEVVFVKIKDRMVDYHDNRERVAAYEKWLY